METQKILFEAIREVLPSDELLVDHIANVLHISKHQAYSRISSKTWLDFSSGKKLMDHFRIPAERIFGQVENEIKFKYSNLNLADLGLYFSYIEQLTGMLNAAKLKKDCNMIFLADDIPIFHYMPFPELVLFKLYSWSVDTMGIDMVYEAFIEQIQREELNTLFAGLYKAYLEIPSVEVWNHSTIDVILNEIVEYSKFRLFGEHSSIALLLEQVDCIWENHKEWGSQRKKTCGQSFDLFYSNVPALGGKMLLEAQDFSRAVIKLYPVNSISTNDTSFIEELKRYMRSVVDRGMLIGASTREKRLQFEQVVEDKIRKTKELLLLR